MNGELIRYLFLARTEVRRENQTRTRARTRKAKQVYHTGRQHGGVDLNETICFLVQLYIYIYIYV